MFVFRNICRTLFSWNTRFEIRLFASLPTSSLTSIFISFVLILFSWKTLWNTKRSIKLNMNKYIVTEEHSQCTLCLKYCQCWFNIINQTTRKLHYCWKYWWWQVFLSTSKSIIFWIELFLLFYKTKFLTFWWISINLLITFLFSSHQC